MSKRSLTDRWNWKKNSFSYFLLFSEKTKNALIFYQCIPVSDLPGENNKQAIYEFDKK